MALIAIDMTPALPGGENGGVKLLALELIKGFQKISTNNSYLLLTSSWNDDELSALDSTNTQRLCVIDRQSTMMSEGSSLLNQMERRVRNIRRFVRRYYNEKIKRTGFLSERGVDLLFCPYTAPTFAEAGMPVVSLICDLQHKDYPQFFTSNEIYARESFLSEVQRRADLIICISENTRKSVIRYLNVAPDKTVTIPICIHSRLASCGAQENARHRRNLDITDRPFMFYPANFWPHKNHDVLLTAYGNYLSRHPASDMDLVFTGALDVAQRDLLDKASTMGLARRVHFLGYLPEDQLTAVWEGCSFLVFPSLYEGFGIPILEAMQFGKPVLCSNVTSLPEIAGDAALYFDPRKPEEIVQGLEKITGNEELCTVLVQRGYERISHFQPLGMVNKYLGHFENLCRTNGESLHG